MLRDCNGIGPTYLPISVTYAVAVHFASPVYLTVVSRQIERPMTPLVVPFFHEKNSWGPHLAVTPTASHRIHIPLPRKLHCMPASDYTRTLMAYPAIHRYVIHPSYRLRVCEPLFGRSWLVRHCMPFKAAHCAFATVVYGLLCLILTTSLFVSPL